MPATKKSKSNDGKAILTSTTIDDLTALTTAQLYALSSRRHRDESREVRFGEVLPLDMVYLSHQSIILKLKLLATHYLLTLRNATLSLGRPTCTRGT